MNSLYAALLAAHLIADYPLQTEWMVQNKHDHAFALLSHGVFHVAVTAALLTSTVTLLGAIGLGLVVGAVHVAVDAIDLHIRWDQTAHFGFLTAIYAAVTIP